MKKPYKYNIFKLLKNKEKNLETKGEKYILHRKQRRKILQTSCQTCKWENNGMTSSKRGKEKICQRNSLLSKNIFQNEGELKTKIKREFISHRPLLQEMLEEFLQAEGV